ncbi:CAF17-like 4Fe-4S cluster assembly/insertion protein YgfZ [Dyella jejuensis]
MSIVDADTDVVRLGCGSHSLLFGNDLAANDIWQHEQLREGWPWLPTDRLNELTPPSLSLHRLGAIALDKGCYPGQEIVARLHYRGGNKRHLCHVLLSAVVASGTELRRSDREFVRLLLVVARDECVEALAVIADDVSNNLAQGTENTSDEGIVVQLVNSWPD